MHALNFSVFLRSSDLKLGRSDLGVDSSEFSIEETDSVTKLKEEIEGEDFSVGVFS